MLRGVVVSHLAKHQSEVAVLIAGDGGLGSRHDSVDDAHLFGKPVVNNGTAKGHRHTNTRADLAF